MTFTLLRTVSAAGSPSGRLIERETVATIDADGIGDALDTLTSDMDVILWTEDNAVIPMDDGFMLPVHSDDIHHYCLHWTD